MKMPGRIIKTKDLTSSQAVYLVAYSVYLITMILRSTMFARYLDGRPFKVIILLCGLMLVYKEYLDSNYRISLILSLVVIGCMIFIIHKNATFTTAAVLLFIYCGRNVPFKKISDVTLFITLILLGVIIAFAETGIITNYVMDPGSNREREFLGFMYALYPSAYLVNCFMLIFYDKKADVPWLVILIFALANQWIYAKTDARLSYIMMLILIVSEVFLKTCRHFAHRKYIYNPLKFLYVFGGVFSYIICFIGSVYMMIHYDPSVQWQEKLNSVLAQRLNFAHQSFLQYGVTVLGQRIEWVGNGLTLNEMPNSDQTLYVDNAFLQVLQRYGILIMIIFLIIITIVLYRCFLNVDWYLFYILLLLVTHALVDDLVIKLSYNTFLIFIGVYLFEKGSRNHLKITSLVRTI